MATYKYQQNMFSGSSEGYVQYNISPDFGTRLLPGDSFTISGKLYSRDFKVFGIEVSATVDPTSFSAAIMGSLAKTVNKGASATFSMKCTVPDSINTLSAERGFAAFLKFAFMNSADLSGGTELTTNANQKLSLLKERVAPVVSDVTVTDTSGAYDHFGGFVRGKSDISISASYIVDPLDPNTLPESMKVQFGDTVLTPTEVTFENGKATAKFGFLDLGGTFTDYVVAITDNRGKTGAYTGGSIEFFEYVSPLLLAFGDTDPVQRYTTNLEDDGTEKAYQDDAGEYLWCTFAGDVCEIMGKNAWKLEMGISIEGEKAEFETVRTGVDGGVFDYDKDQTLIPRTRIFPAAQRYVVEFRLSDFFETAVIRCLVDKAGGYAHLEKYGFAVGMRTTATPDKKKFEVAADYSTYFYGPVYDAEGNSIVGGTPEWRDLPINTTNITDNAAMYAKDGSVVNIQGTVKLKARLETDKTVVVATIPEGFRPRVTSYFPNMMGGLVFRVNVNADGTLSVSNFSSSPISNAYALPLMCNYMAGN
jgi:hypothetical protein